MYEARYASREDIDAAMRLGCGYPMGPLALLDLIGLDTAYEILDTMYKESRDRLHAPAPIIKQMVTAGLRGRKSGHGFYTYAAPGSSTVVADALTPVAGGGEDAGRTVNRVGVVGSGTMATGIIEVFAKSGFDTVYVARIRREGRGGPGGDPEVADQGGRPREAHRGGAGRRPGARHGHLGLEDLSDVDLVVEAVVEDIGVKTALFAQLDEHLQAGHRPGHDDLEPAGRGDGRGHVASGGRHRDALLQPRRDHAAGRGRRACVDRRRTSSRRSPRSARRTGKHAVHCGDRAGFIVNALLFPYLNDAIKMLVGAVRDGRRDRPGHEEGLRAADGARSSCSTSSATTCRWRSRTRCTGSSGSRGSRRRRCSSTWCTRGIPGAQDRPRVPQLRAVGSRPHGAAAELAASPASPRPGAALTESGPRASIDEGPDRAS